MRNRSEEERKRILEEVYGVKVDEKMAKEMKEMSELGMYHYDMGRADGKAEGREEGVQLGIQQGITQGMQLSLLDSIKNAMASFNLTLKEAMNGLKVPESEQSYYEERIKELEKNSE